MAKQKQVVKIKKRDGRIVPFEPEKIATAIFKAAQAVGGRNRKLAAALAGKVARLLNEKFDGHTIPNVEQVQDFVEKVLIEEGHAKTAKAYILYRDQHARLRDLRKFIDSDQLIEGYLSQLDWRVRENSNMTFSLQGLNNHVASAVSSHYWLHKIYPPEVRDAHLNRDLHIHDLQLLSAYCTGWDLRDLLLRGFGGVSGKIESMPPKHLRTALGQVVNFFYTVQGEIAGAVAFSNFDTYLAPFIHYDKLSYGEVKQCLQEFIFNMNVPTRVGFQTPFTNITLDLTVPANVKDEPVVIGGKLQKENYGAFQKEMDIFNQAFGEVMLEGDAKGRVFSFPIPTINITRNFTWNKKEWRPIWEMTAKYGVPYFANFVNSDMKSEDARSMCPIAAREKVLIQSSRGRGLEYVEIKNTYEGNKKGEKYEIYSDGKFVRGHFNKFKDQKMIEILLENGHKFQQSDEHLNYVLEDSNAKVKELKGKDLKRGMYLPYSLNIYQGRGGNKDLGYFVGAYAGDGSFDDETAVVFSLEGQRKKEVIERLQRVSQKFFGANYQTKIYPGQKLLTLRVYSRAAVGLCKDFVAGKKRGKYYRARIFGTSIDFRKGVIEGHYATDGGNRHRIYTSSPKMVESLNMLAATLGTTTNVYKDKRQGRLGEEPNYAVLIYQLNRKRYGHVWFKKDDKLWVRIERIKRIANSVAYCFEVLADEPVFTVGTTGILTHNCRLRLDNRELRKRGGGLFGANPLTGSIGVVTINLPRLGYLAKNKSDFFKRLEKVMAIARESLRIKREVLERFTEEGLYPYCRHYLDKIKEGFNEYWRNHFNTIGLLGMNEAALNLLKTSIASRAGHKFALDTLRFMRERLMDYQNTENQLYNLEATPGEGTSYSFAKQDKENYPKIIVANEKAYQTGAKPYYTNSTHLPVNFTDDFFEALDRQDDLQSLYTGGTVIHGFLGERLPNIAAVKKLVKKIAYQYHLPYFTLTPTFSICPKHGYLAGEHEYCPKCDAEIGYGVKLKTKNVSPRPAR